MNRHRFWISIWVCYISIVVMSCNNEPKKVQNTENKVETNAYKLVSPDFNSDTAYHFVQKQLDFGPRVTNTPAHTATAAWIQEQFKLYTDRVILQQASVSNYEGKKLNIKNIIASVNPKAKQRILICTHWDSRPYADEDPNTSNHDKAVPAADDGASGVAVMLEMARTMTKVKPGIGVDFICFDAEDWGKTEHGENSYCLGSQYWSANKHEPGYTANYGILLDMVGSVGATFGMEGYSMRYAPDVVKNVWTIASKLGYSSVFLFNEVGGITDDHKYVNTIAHIPTIDIINFSDKGFAPHWHTLNDNIAIIDRRTLKAVGQTLLEVVYTQQ